MIFTSELTLFQKSFWTKSENPDKIAIFKRQPIFTPAPPGNVHKTYTNVTVHADPDQSSLKRKIRRSRNLKNQEFLTWATIIRDFSKTCEFRG
jgi:hypothetical protein